MTRQVGAATTGPAPWTDAAVVFGWARVDESVAMADVADFTAAAGLDLVRDRPILTAMTALRLVDTARWAADRRPDLYPELVQRSRTGLRRLGLSG